MGKNKKKGKKSDSDAGSSQEHSQQGTPVHENIPQREATQGQPQHTQSEFESTSGATQQVWTRGGGRGRGQTSGVRESQPREQGQFGSTAGASEQQGQTHGRGRGAYQGGRGFQHAGQDQPRHTQSEFESTSGATQQLQTRGGGRGRGQTRGDHRPQQGAQGQYQSGASVSEQQGQPGAGGRGKGQHRGGQHAQSRTDVGQQQQIYAGERKLAGGDQLDSQIQTVKQAPERMVGDGQQMVSKVVTKSDSNVENMIEAMQKLNVGGKQGRPIKVLANHFELKIGKIQKVIHYDVDINPDKPKKLLKMVVHLFKNKYFPRANPAFDGKKNLYSANELPFGYEIEGKVTLEDEGRSKEYVVKIKQVNVIDLSNINKFVNQYKTRNMAIKEPLNAVQALDVILRHSLSLRFITSGSSFYPPPQQLIPLGDGMEMYRGMFQSVTLGWKPFINIDVANKAFPSEMNIIDLICELMGQSVLNQYLREWDLDKLNKALRTLRVRIDIPNCPSSKRTMKVNKLESSSDRFTFKKDDGSTQTVQDYFLKEKRVHLKFPKMPCVWVGNLQKKIMYPCELCTILPGQVVNRKLTANQTRCMIKECATDTTVRMNSIKNSIQHANYNADPVIKEFDLSVSNEFQVVNGRVLDPPGIKYLEPPIQKVMKGVWRANKFIKPVTIRTWYVLNLDARLYAEKCELFAKQIQIRSRQLGVTIPPPAGIETLDVRRRPIDTLKSYFAKCANANIIFVIITEEQNMYNYVKQVSELYVGCLTQCIKSKTILKRLDESTIINVMLKVNAKLNGTNHNFAQRPFIMQTPTMVMGADVTHPGPDSQTIPSFAAVTASFDPVAYQYNLCWRIQPPTQEIITDLQAIFREQLLFFYQKNNGMKPQKIIFYRDGVSNGQFNAVLNSELQAMRRACQSLEQNYKPAFTFIVVQKRHHTRLFPANFRDSEDRNKNVPAGTCVDTDITLPTRQNFFLVSHASIQGVAKPTRYVTLWDDNNFSDDELEQFTYQLCHLFTRCTRSVSYPAPTYYAHLAAARAKVYCETEQLNMHNLEHEQTRFQIKECIIKGLPMFFV